MAFNVFPRILGPGEFPRLLHKGIRECTGSEGVRDSPAELEALWASGTVLLVYPVGVPRGDALVG